MQQYTWVSFLTDYGLDDGYVASCHGVIATIAPQARIIDITHLVPPQDVRRGAAVLAQTVPSLPPSVHLAVVDPGVGTPRRGIAITTPGGILVGPDNGLLLPAAAALGGPTAIHELTETAYWAPTISYTFHGRDIFAPVAAHLIDGVQPAQLGEPIDPRDLVRLPEPSIYVQQGRLTAEIIAIDHFGNIQLAAAADHLTKTGLQTADRVAIGRHIATIGNTFGDAPTGDLVAFVDHIGLVELACNQASAHQLLDAHVGDMVVMEKQSQE